MKLTDPEKLILIMLSDIYEKLGIEHGIDPHLVKTAIFNDQTWALRWKYPGIFLNSESVDPPSVKETLDIMRMWEMIEEAYAKLSGPEKEALKPDARSFVDFRFRGFDIGDDHFGVAQFLINELERYSNFKGRDLNSHFPVVERYIRMVEVFNPIFLELEGRSLNVEELKKIFKAQK